MLLFFLSLSLLNSFLTFRFLFLQLLYIINLYLFPPTDYLFDSPCSFYQARPKPFALSSQVESSPIIVNQEQQRSGREPGEKRGGKNKRIQKEKKQEDKAKIRRVCKGKWIKKISFIFILLQHSDSLVGQNAVHEVANGILLKCQWYVSVVYNVLRYSILGLIPKTRVWFSLGLSKKKSIKL